MATTRSAKYTRPPLFPYQIDAIFGPERYAIVEACTKSGKTVTCIAWLFEQALQGKPGVEFWWVAPVLDQAKIAFRRFKRYARPKSMYVVSESELSATLMNGTVIRFRSGDNPESLYGEDVGAAVLDEASRMKEDVFPAVRSTLTATNGSMRIIGNVHGAANWMYRAARRAEAGLEGWKFSRITADDTVAVGLLPQSEIDDAEQVMDYTAFRQLYYAEAREDEGNPFGLQAIRACIAPMSEEEPVAFGWDLGRTMDYTVGIGLDRDGTVCAFERFKRPWDSTLLFIRSETGSAPALVDGTGLGGPVLEMLRAEGHRNFLPYVFTTKSKQELIDELAIAIHSGTVRFPDGPIAAELAAFQYEMTATGERYGAPAGVHDDCVIALALAVRQRRIALKPRPKASVISYPGRPRFDPYAMYRNPRW